MKTSARQSQASEDDGGDTMARVKTSDEARGIALKNRGARGQTKGQLKRIVGGCLLALLVGSLVALTIAYISFRKDLRAARSRLADIPSQVYSSKYGDIEYLLAGEGPTVLVSHGVTGGVDQGMALTHEFAMFAPHYRFLYVSRFGYLKSSLPKGASARLQAAAYKELLDHLGVDMTFVFGNSAGGPSAMWFAADYPERTKGLILASSAVPGVKVASAPGPVFKNDFVYWLAVKAVPGMLLKMFVPKSYSLTASERDFLVKNAFVAGLPISARSEGVLFDNKVSTPSVTEIPFESIIAPTLIIHAVDDPAPPIEGAREVAERIPGSKLVTLDGGHFLLRHAQEIQRLTGEFIASNQ